MGASVLKCAALFWAGGVVFVLARKIRAFRRFQQLLSQHKESVVDGAVLALFAQISAELGLKHPVALYQSGLIQSPLLTGVRRPVIFLPKAMLDGARSDLGYSLKHELIHEQSKDIVYKWAIQGVCALHWFNPVVQLLPGWVSRAGELACDERVCQDLSWAERMAYGQVLLSLSTKGGLGKVGLFCTTMGTDGRKLKARLGVVKTSQAPSAGQSGLWLVG